MVPTTRMPDGIWALHLYAGTGGGTVDGKRFLTARRVTLASPALTYMALRDIEMIAMEVLMGSLLVRDVSDDLVMQLKARARANGRSAEAEHRDILRRSLAQDDGARFEELAARLRALTAGRPQTPAEDLMRETRNER